MVLGREGGTETAINQQDDDGDGLLRHQNHMSGCNVFSCLISCNADRIRRRVLGGRGCDGEVCVSIPLNFSHLDS